MEVFRRRLLSTNAGDTTVQAQRAPSKLEGQASQVIIRHSLLRIHDLLQPVLECIWKANSRLVASKCMTGATSLHLCLPNHSICKLRAAGSTRSVLYQALGCTARLRRHVLQASHVPTAPGTGAPSFSPGRKGPWSSRLLARMRRGTIPRSHSCCLAKGGATASKLHRPPFPAFPCCMRSKAEGTQQRRWPG